MELKKRALITGVTGQDGSYLADLLISKGYKVYGFVRRTSKPNLDNVRQLLINPDFHLVYGDLTDQASINRAVIEALPDEVYNLGAQSFVAGSWEYPTATSDITGLGALRLLEALRQFNPKARYYQASSSEMFGNQVGSLSEDSILQPRSPYGTAKAFAHYTTINYRESYGIHASCGILFNHESPRRGIEFVTRKITDAVVRIKLGQLEKFSLGNIKAQRDWGDSRDYVLAMWMMLQQDMPDNYVIATGKPHSIEEFLAIAFDYAGLGDYHKYIDIDPGLYRPAEIEILKGDPLKAHRTLGWYPTYSLADTIRDMIAEDFKRNK